MPEPIRYDVDLSDRAHHLVRVTLRVPADLAAGARVVMSTWTPGSYVIRDYVHHVQWIRALADGVEVELSRDGHTAWRLGGDVRAPVDVVMELYANDLTVRTNHVDDHHALLIPAATFPWVDGARSRVHEVRLEPFPDHHRVFSLLPAGEAAHTYVADDLDHLIDGAFEVGDLPSAEWDVEGVPHRFVWAGYGRAPDLTSFAADAEAIARATVALFDDRLPARGHTTLCVAWNRGGGGLEHRDGAVLQVPSHAFGDATTLAKLHALYAHEYLHLYNGKRLVPAPLVEPDLERPTHTSSLWVTEGWTSYYDELLPTRAGVWAPRQLIDHLADGLEGLEQVPGAGLQSLRQASHEAWVKHYVRDENSPNAGTDYYRHGALVAWELDLRLRATTPAPGGLDDVLRLLWRRHAGDRRGYTEEDVLDAIAAVGGDELGELAEDRTASPGGPDVDAELLESFGLRFDEHEPSEPDLGVVVTEDESGVVLASVLRHRAAWRAGVTGGDRLVAVDGVTIGRGELSAALAGLAGGDEVELTVIRGPRLLDIPVAIDPPRRRRRIVVTEETTAGQREAFENWTGQPPATSQRPA